MSGMLAAIPGTPLHDRLAAEGRLDRADVSEYGTNVVPPSDDPRRPAQGWLSARAQLSSTTRAPSTSSTGSFVPWIKTSRSASTRRKMVHVPRFIGLELVFVFEGIGLFLRW